ncbi:MAG: bifunctional (p)ppGpp synthetase/guanosine-3',5'-bis(diphosphate) 3'-pyrophosphohydrolase [Elusimicrobia bacterium]|nr:bifunctional (p)ppGpp synthetase/guanosine-3',5'-bis(diphosphate) 3'-pyrophosphohydrolase [Elusimicrobiota bacterium]
MPGASWSWKKERSSRRRLILSYAPGQAAGFPRLWGRSERTRSERLKTYIEPLDPSIIEKAYDFSKNCHKTQLRASKEPFFIHCLATANILLDLKLDVASVCACLLHDCMEDSDVVYAELENNFGKEIADLVDGVTKLDRLHFTDHAEFEAENWRKTLIALAKDISIILIKLADRLHNMRTIRFLGLEDQKRIAQESLALYASIADRLGMFAIKSELEDLSFSVLEPDLFRDVSFALDRQTAQRQEYLKIFSETLSEKVKRLNVPFRFTFRPKHIYSIYQKMQRQKKALTEIEDTMGIRIVTDTLASCYLILGEIHSAHKPVPNAFNDYIANPKQNLYQSIHTSIYGPEDKIVEVQIRTEEMNKRAEHGIAAHWKYKLTSQEKVKEKDLEASLGWLKEWLEWIQDLKSPAEFLEILKTELKVHQIFVFTPRMEVKALPENATPVDFAYAVHSDIGDHCMGAKVGGSIVRLDSPLKSGDVCEILVRKNVKPNKDWLKFVKTARARSKIRRAFKEKQA